MNPDFKKLDSNGVTVSEYRFIPSEDRLYRKMTQPSRDMILERNAEMRKNAGILKDLSFARLSLRIPLVDMEILKRKYPVLSQGSNHEQKLFWHKFIKTTESAPYRVY